MLIRCLRCCRCAFIEFETDELRDAAVDKKDGIVLQKQLLRIQPCTNRTKAEKRLEIEKNAQKQRIGKYLKEELVFFFSQLTVIDQVFFREWPKNFAISVKMTGKSNEVLHTNLQALNFVWNCKNDGKFTKWNIVPKVVEGLGWRLDRRFQLNPILHWWRVGKIFSIMFFRDKSFQKRTFYFKITWILNQIYSQITPWNLQLLR